MGLLVATKLSRCLCCWLWLIVGLQRSSCATLSSTSRTVEPPSELALLSTTRSSAAYMWSVPTDACGNGSTISSFVRALNGRDPIQTSNGIVTMDSIFGLRPHTRYSVAVRVSCDGGGMSNFSSPLDFTTSEFTSSRPLNLTAVNGDRGTGMVVVSWAPPAQPKGVLTGYRVTLTPDNTVANSSNRAALRLMAHTGNETNMTTVAPARSGVAYCVVVRAVNTFGLGEAASVKILADCGVSCANGGTFDEASCKCICSRWFAGTNCSVCTNSTECLNGGEFNEDSCSCGCRGGFTGDTCDVCSLSCQNNGALNSTLCECACSGGYTGLNCQTLTIPPITLDMAAIVGLSVAAGGILLLFLLGLSLACACDSCSCSRSFCGRKKDVGGSH